MVDGRVTREFEVHGAKVRPVHLTRQQHESRAPPAVQPDQLPDFGDSLVSAPPSTIPSRPEPAHTDEPTPPTLRDEALMSEMGRSGGSRQYAPMWAEPQDELDDQVYDWLQAGEQTRVQDEVGPQDSVSVRDQLEEPMERRNHGATTAQGEQWMRRQAQRRANRDERARIPRSIERRPPSPDSRMQLRRHLKTEDQCLQRKRLHQSRRSVVEARTREDDIQTRRYQYTQPKSFMEEEDWRTITHSGKRYRQPAEHEPN